MAVSAPWLLEVRAASGHHAHLPGGSPAQLPGSYPPPLGHGGAPASSPVGVLLSASRRTSRAGRLTRPSVASDQGAGGWGGTGEGPGAPRDPGVVSIGGGGTAFAAPPDGGTPGAHSVDEVTYTPTAAFEGGSRSTFPSPGPAIKVRLALPLPPPPCPPSPQRRSAVIYGM